MTREFIIRVRYPRPGAGRMVLRTEFDWDANVEPSRVSDDGATAEFRISADTHHMYFKPCIVDGDAVHWASGGNFLALRCDGDGVSVYPDFFAGTRGSISAPIEIASAELGRQVRVRVYQPPGYRENAIKRYPVLYMHDGTNLFFPQEAFLGDEWQVDETMDALDDMNLIGGALVVGIYAGDRMHEYTQSGYDAYGRFITRELVPMIGERYRVLTGPEHTAVMGSSLGGVVSFYLAWQFSEIFGNVGCMSSTFSWRDDLMSRVWDEPKRPLKIYLDSGWPGDNFEINQCMRDALIGRGYQIGSELLYFAFPGAAHNERAWAARLHLPFQFFFARAPTFPPEHGS